MNKFSEASSKFSQLFIAFNEVQKQFGSISDSHQNIATKKMHSILLILLLSGSVFAAEELSFPRNNGWSVEEENISHWKNRGDEELLRAAKLRPIRKKAKNVILFMGDGMGVQTLTAQG